EADQFGAVLEALDIAGANPDAAVLQHGAHDLGERDVRLVARVDEVAEAEAAAARERGDRGAESARLGNESDRTRRGRPVSVLAEGRDHPLERIHEAEAIRTADAHAGGAGIGLQARFQARAFRAHLGEAGAEHDRGRYALAPEILDRR